MPRREHAHPERVYLQRYFETGCIVKESSIKKCSNSPQVWCGPRYRILQFCCRCTVTLPSPLCVCANTRTRAHSPLQPHTQHAVRFSTQPQSSPFITRLGNTVLHRIFLLLIKVTPSEPASRAGSGPPGLFLNEFPHCCNETPLSRERGGGDF